MVWNAENKSQRGVKGNLVSFPDPPPAAGEREPGAGAASGLPMPAKDGVTVLKPSWRPELLALVLGDDLQLNSSHQQAPGTS